MRNLIQFLKKFRDFLVFFILQVIVLTLFFNSKDYHRSRIANTSSTVIGWFVEKKHNITKHFSLSEANQALLEENAQLRARLPESFYRLQGDVFYINDSIKKQQFQYIPATVINSSFNKRNNYYTLDQGSSQGIEIGMGVISDQGVIGIVTDVSKHYAIVMSVLSDKIRVNVKLKKNNEFWLLNWDGLDHQYGQILEVKRDIQLEVGDEVVTRGGATKFPEGLPVGTIAEIITKDGEQTLSLKIKHNVNYNAVYSVYVVKNMMKDEQLELEERILENE